MSRTFRRPSHRLYDTKEKVKDGTSTRDSHRCENNGSCPWCKGNRLHKHKKQPKIEDFLEDL